jgi:hypothetical protein
MQFFVREHCTMIAAPVQCDVGGIPKGSHCVSVTPTGWTNKLAKIDIALAGSESLQQRRTVLVEGIDRDVRDRVVDVPVRVLNCSIDFRTFTVRFCITADYRKAVIMPGM